MLLLVAMQVLVLNHIHLMGYAMPLVTPLMLMYLPINEGRIVTLIRMFLMGLAVDWLSGTPGQSSFALTLAAMLRPLLLQLTMPKEHLEDMIPTRQSMGRWGHFVLLTMLTLAHHTAYFLLEAMNYFTSIHFLLTLLSSIVLSISIMMLCEMLRHNKRPQD